MSVWESPDLVSQNAEPVGYARVSTSEQNLNLQLDALQKAGCKKIFEEKMSGALTSRPELDKCFSYLRRGDTLVVYRLDRLGRGMKDLVALINQIKERGIGFKSLTENIDTTSATGELIFHIFASLAQFERRLILERTKAGIEAARKRGVTGGRPKKLAQSEADKLRKMYLEGNVTVRQLCKIFSISTRTLYKTIQLEGKIKVNQDNSTQTT